MTEALGSGRELPILPFRSGYSPAPAEERYGTGEARGWCTVGECAAHIHTTACAYTYIYVCVCVYISMFMYMRTFMNKEDSCSTNCFQSRN